MSEYRLEVRGVTKVFPGTRALDQVQLQVRPGEVHALCGENGAGKSTLMNIIGGVFPPTEGEILFEGAPIAPRSPKEAQDIGIGFVHQELSLCPHLTAAENIFIGRLPHKGGMIDFKRLWADADMVLKQFNANFPSSALVSELTVSEQQIIEIAKSVSLNCKLLILDEPTSSLTEKETARLFDLVKELSGRGISILYISHRMAEIFEICDRVTVIRDGQYISTKNVKDTNKDELVADMVGRKMGNYYPKTDTFIGEKIFEVRNYYDEGFLNDINFFVRKGEILGFAGLAGAGRTELMESICGLKGKAAGFVYLNGTELHIHNYEEAMEQGIVYVSEDRGKYGLIVDMEIKQNISMPQLKNFRKTLGILDRKKETEAGEKYIREVDIKAPNGEFLVKNLSGGNQQKVSVAKALALNPQILVLDEPTRGVDVNAKAEIHRIISALTEKGLTIIMVSSELPELIGMCDRIYVMREGSIAGCFTREDVTQEKILNVALQSEEKGGKNHVC